MKELEFLEKINEIDPDLLEEKTPARSRRLGRVLRVAAVVAVLALVLTGTVYALTRSRHVEMEQIDTPEGAGFEAKVELPLVSWDSFRGEIRSAGETIARQYAEPEPQDWTSSYYADPSLCERSFGSIEEAMAYVGLAELKTPTFPYENTPCTVTAQGDETGAVSRVRLHLEHIAPTEICAQETVTVLTDAATDPELVTGGVWTYEFPRDVEFLNCLTPGGNECRIAVLRPEYDSDYMSLDGYVAVGSALYELNLAAVPVAEYDRAVEILHAWANALD